MRGRRARTEVGDVALLEFQDVSIAYGDGGAAVSHVSFSVGTGEAVCIVGESGSGKSTLLKAVLGLLPRNARWEGGSITFGGDGRVAPLAKGGKLPFVLGREVGVIFQNAGQYVDPISRVGVQFDEMLRAHGVPRSQARALEVEMLERVHLADPEHVLHAYPFELSGGMMQRVAIAMAISLKPVLLLADEPTSALDVTSQDLVVSELCELNRDLGMSLLLVTHNMAVAEAVSNKVGVMHDGRLVEFGMCDQVLGDPQDAYTKSLMGSIVRWGDDDLE